MSQTSEKTLPVKRLTCAVCGEHTRGRQWHNRDTGFGVCETCVIWHKMLDHYTPEELVEFYGYEGYHYNI